MTEKDRARDIDAELQAKLIAELLTWAKEMDRSAKSMREAGLHDIAPGNAFIASLLERAANELLARSAARAEERQKAEAEIAELRAEVERLKDAHVDRDTWDQMGIATVVDLRASEAARVKAEAERDEALRLMSQYAREAGEATGRLEMSEAAGIVDGWRERAEAAEHEANAAHLKLAQVTRERDEAVEVLRPFVRRWTRTLSAIPAPDDYRRATEFLARLEGGK